MDEHVSLGESGNADKGRAWIELDKRNLYNNISVLSRLLPKGCSMMPAVKANAYGHGAVLIAKALNEVGIKAFCVASAKEGIELRKNGIMGDILILGYTHPSDFPFLKKYHLMQTVVDYPYAKRLDAFGEKLKVHIKIDTGMHRLGERAEHIDEIYNMFHLEHLQIDGIFTHLCAADTAAEPARDFTLKQASAFYHLLIQLEKRGIICPKIHLQSSDGLINYPDLHGDYVRAGIAIYGLLSTRHDVEKCPVSLSPVLSVKARIAAIKDLYKGETAGYGLYYVADQNRKIAVLSIGYADGLPRALSCGMGKVLINGHAATVIGNICMDQTLVDITDIPDVKQGDIAVIIGTSGNLEISAYDIAESTGTITNEVLSRLGTRLERMMI